MKTRIHALYDAPMSGAAIETRSFEIIDSEADREGLDDREWAVVRRMVHTAGDFGFIRDVRLSTNAIDAGIAALRDGRSLYVDSNMIRSGLSMARLRAVCPDYGPERLVCHVRDDAVAREAKEAGLPRSLFAVRKARPMLDGAIVVFGNAPVALLELNRLIVEEGVRPAIVIGMPVGFVHVTESKEELLGLNVPHIVLNGRRGGSALAVSVVHALCGLAGVQDS